MSESGTAHTLDAGHAAFAVAMTQDLSARSTPSPPVSRVPSSFSVLTPNQLAAIRLVMHLFVSDDLAHGVRTAQELQCNSCQTRRPMPGLVKYEDYQFCNACATRYEVARMRGVLDTPAQFVRSPRPKGRRRRRHRHGSHR